MVKIVLSVAKKLSFAFLLLYGINLILSSVDIIIPINVVTIGCVGSLGFPGLFSLVAIFFLTK